ncbi:MAG: homoprotocatechuate degradation operon regulator HpaR [Gammaproteobacteria bacterium]|nr:homoprotocatechuate degradation operon regulator HpaR [Gammaproteobacteria bacterium]
MAGTATRRVARSATALREFELSLPMQLLKAREAAMARFRPMLREHGLTDQQWRVIRVLADSADLDAGEIARRSLLLAPSLSRILQFLEAEGLVRRRPDPADQRRGVFALTARGERRFAAVAPDSERLYAEIAARFGAARLDELYDLLEAFCVALEAD